MITAWTQGKTAEEKEQYIRSLRNSRWILDDLSKIIQKHDADLEYKEISPRAYDNANWPYRQAHTNGYRQAMRTILNLIDLKDTDDRSISEAGRPPAN